MPLACGQALSRFQIFGPLGAGGMGEVYRARDTHLGRDVAIKVLPVELARDETRLVTNLQDRIPLWPHQYTLSPDDRWLSMPLMDEGTTNLWIISAEDGSLRQITDFERSPTLVTRQVSWSRDSRFLFAAVTTTDADVVLLEGALR